jgi:hypothetical protein
MKTMIINEVKCVMRFVGLFLIYAAWMANGYDFDHYIFSSYLLDADWWGEALQVFIPLLAIYFGLSIGWKLLKRSIINGVAEVMIRKQEELNK